MAYRLGTAFPTLLNGFDSRIPLSHLDIRMEARRCSACHTSKPLNQFKIKSVHPDRVIYQAYCIPCQREYRKRHYRANKEEYLRRVRERNQRLRRLVQDAKAKPCADCGVQYAPWQMDFDHVRGVKVKGLANLLGWKVSIRKVLAEIAKCEVVCANCHRDRTHHRRMLRKQES